MTPTGWLIGNDTGLSSKTLFAVMAGELRSPTQCGGQYAVPSDPDDFGRCYRLLQLFPKWKNRMNEVAELLPAWRPLVREWNELARLYERDFKSGKCSELYERMQGLNEEGRILDGWLKTGPGCWSRGSAMSVSLKNGVTISTGGRP